MAFGRVRQACISRRKLLPPRPPPFLARSENIDKCKPSRYNQCIIVWIVTGGFSNENCNG